MIASMFQLSLQEFVDTVSTLEFNIEEWGLALEIYLQMDIDCFYWKTEAKSGMCVVITSVYR